jgi:hypothetical protein
MRTVPLLALALLGLLLGGCSPESAPRITPTPSLSPDPEPTASAQPEVAEVFTMPTACHQILTADTLRVLETRGLVLLGGPDGVYGDDYLLEPSPEQEAGGITCIWGDPDTEISSVTISVAPLSAATRAEVVSSLAVEQGLNETIGETASYYWLLGDDEHAPAMLNVLTADSWISVIQTIGGDANYTEAENLAIEVHGRVYGLS